MKKQHKSSMFYDARPVIFAHANTLRLNMTDAEKMLWEKLRKNQIMGLRFKAQHPIDNFIADFYCHKLKLVIEVDGGIHESKEQKDYDRGRETELEQLGIKVIRFTNQKILKNINEVVEEIKKECVKLQDISSPGLRKRRAAREMPPPPEGEKPLQ